MHSRRHLRTARPVRLGTAVIAGALSVAADTVLAVESCVAKGNCARAFMNVGLLALSRRVPGLRVGRGLKGCFRSFSGDTRVLMADGTTKAISRIKPGDLVLAADPRSGERGPRTVTRILAHRDTMSSLTVADARLTTTADHPFWNATEREWDPADRLDPGDLLATADGGTASAGRIAAVRNPQRTAYNFTVNDLHTYFVLAGHTPILVHNACIPWSSTSVGRVAGELERGSVSVTVANRSQAEELFLRLYQGKGYHNTTGMSGKQAREFHNTKRGTYHWDTEMTPGLTHSHTPHLQVHESNGTIIRIFYGG